MRTEIEVKAYVTDSNDVRDKLIALGCKFADPVHQDDMVYTEKVGTLETFLSNDVFLRIRIQNDGRVMLTAKQSVKKTAESLVKIEHETVVSSAEEARAILNMMGYQQAVRVKKMRRTAHFKDYEICLDDIEGLDSFIELEQMGESEDAEKIQKDMFTFLMSLGISPEQQVKKGYDILMIEKSLR
jgi:adenylate cyclase class 2